MWMSCCHRKLPGAMPLQGAVRCSTEAIEDMLRYALAREAKDIDDVVRGFLDSAVGKRGLFMRKIDELNDVMVAEKPVTSALTVDAVMLSFVILARFLGKIQPGEILSYEEMELLPAVCLNAAMKIEDSTCGTVVPKLLRALHVSRRARLETKQAMSRLEMKVLSTLQYRLLSPTPITFLHHVIARAVSVGEFSEEDAVGIGKEATQTTFRLVRSGFCSVYRTSEIASVCAFIAAFSVRGVFSETAQAVGCRLDSRSTLTLLFLAVDPSQQVVHASGNRSSGGGGSRLTRASNGGPQLRREEENNGEVYQEGPLRELFLHIISAQWKANFPAEVRVFSPFVSWHFHIQRGRHIESIYCSDLKLQKKTIL